MKVGDLVRVKKPSTPDKRYLGKLGVVINNGTWSADIHIFGSSSSWNPRIAKEKLEAITCK